ncbi:MAG: FAD-dependent oxidoreductase [Desulfobacterales bacterium]|nr:FAD-dependent oxidoreductase [Desulfobacterales bacterium]
METNYLILGASHAGLSALESIRRHDQESSLTIVTAEPDHLYSPTALPYVIAGKTSKGFMDIRKEDYFYTLNANLIKDARATGLDTAKKQVVLNHGIEINYDKLLIATGAAAWVPPVPGLDGVDYFCIRTLEDATVIRKNMTKGDSAVVIGAGFIGMHAAENLANAGLRVSVVETLDRIMPASFDAEASRRIEKVFLDKGITILTGRQVSSAGRSNGRIVLSLSDGENISADLVIVAAGISPNTGFLKGSGINCEQGIVVDERLRTSAGNVWAAGDVAAAPGFFSGSRAVGGTIPCAAEQGRTAGMDMAGDDYVTDYPGNLNMNTFGFFDNFAFSIGNIANHSSQKGSEVHSSDDPAGKPAGSPANNSFWKFVFQDNALTGVSAINCKLDPGILKQLILNKTDLSSRKEAFIKAPLEVGRQLMRELF